MGCPAVRAKMSAASKAALADPAVRAKMSAASKAAWADPAVRAKMGWLTDEEIGHIVAAINAVPRRSYEDIGADWLVTGGTIARIAREAGVERRPRRGRRNPNFETGALA